MRISRLVVTLDGTVESDSVVGGDDLYESCRRAAFSLIARRLADPICARDPRAAGVLAARLGELGLELAPATSSGDGPPVTGLRVDLPTHVQVEEHEVNVALPGADEVPYPRSHSTGRPTPTASRSHSTGLPSARSPTRASSRFWSGRPPARSR
jgi:hypothetical protein